MIAKHDMCNVLENNGIYTFRIRFPEYDDVIPLFNTNLESIVNYVWGVFEEKADSLTDLEMTIGNLGVIAVSELLSTTFEIIYESISYYEIDGIYFKTLIPVTIYSKNTKDEINTNLLVDTRKDVLALPQFYSFLNNLFSAIFSFSQEKDNSLQIQKVCDVYLSQELVNQLNNCYSSIISLDDLEKYLRTHS